VIVFIKKEEKSDNIGTCGRVIVVLEKGRTNNPRGGRIYIYIYKYIYIER